MDAAARFLAGRGTWPSGIIPIVPAGLVCRPNMMLRRIYTSIAANYIPKARVLANSIKRWHSDIHFTLLLCDEPPPLDWSAEPFDSILRMEDLDIPDLQGWTFKHSLVELSTALKGFALTHFLEELHCSEVLYFDPDIVVLSPLDGLFARLQTASILLTPHLTEPESSIEGIRDNELCALRHGVYNLGFIGVKNSREGSIFANWWTKRLAHFCRDDIPAGMFTDQRWVDLAPAYFADLAILHDPVYNVSTWNLSSRTVEGDLEHGLTIGGAPIVFYHFSGMDSGAQLAMLEKYGRFMPGLFELRDWYLRECDRMGQQEFSGIPWAYGTFDNGEPISPIQRTLYRDRSDLQFAFPNPFLTGDVNRSYYHWFRANGPSAGRVNERPGRTSWWTRLLASRA